MNDLVRNIKIKIEGISLTQDEKERVLRVVINELEGNNFSEMTTKKEKETKIKDIMRDVRYILQDKKKEVIIAILLVSVLILSGIIIYDNMF